jgi:hypothetical protein
MSVRTRPSRAAVSSATFTRTMSWTLLTPNIRRRARSKS